MKIINYNEDSTPSENDLVPITNTPKKITLGNFVRAIIAAVSSFGVVKVTGSSTAVSDDDTRMPSYAEAQAKSGNTGTPSSTNKFVTETDPAIVSNLKNVGTQSVDGVKTFTSIPVSSGTPTNSNDAVTKGYIDALV